MLGYREIMERREFEEWASEAAAAGIKADYDGGWFGPLCIVLAVGIIACEVYRIARRKA
jgi:hypothetical protein